MNSLELTTRSPEQTQEFGTRLGKIARPGDVILLVGKLGAGKTCLTQGIAWGLGIKEYAASPSFVLVRELKGRLPLYHLDFYRLENLAEIAELGLDEYFYGRGVSVVEWAEKALSLLPSEHLLIEMSYVADSERRLQIRARGKRYREMVTQLKQC
jgi:tRNA threonylcarbamoyladenosine biosynthesis protein TsaE